MPVRFDALRLAQGRAARSGGILTIDLAALAANYRSLAALAAPATCGAVVKADAYGLGIARIAPALAAAGCRDFFVAHLDEGLELRALLGLGPRIVVLHGAAPGSEADCVAGDLVPVLNDPAQRAGWQALARRLGRRLPAILQVDTGMTRFGFSAPELAALAADPAAREGIDLQALMSHLACADDPGNGANEAQRAAFAQARRLFPGVPGSLAASSGICLGAGFHADLVRPGAALYGLAPQPGRPNPMRPVVRLQARVMQLRDVPAGVAVGYGHTQATRRETRLATVAIGYADGFLRSASGRGEAWHGAIRLPVVGRVSMDSVVLDVSEVPRDAIAVGSLVDVIGPRRDVDAVARAAGTIGYEVLTRLGHRFHRLYTDA
ncbi:Alanine racemase, catabolic [Methylobacterium organophilum]|uniref:Alanine racemase n=1 Tax=Methylobacterium organophilum TaxID=410 RepID=A0ABQ4TBD3_METOR|nr:Alanine racemase, catabolic [Methylobacterium organophilum]